MSMSCPMCGRIITKREIDQGRAVTVAEGLLCPECGVKHTQRLQSAPAAKKPVETRPASAPKAAAPAAARAPQSAAPAAATRTSSEARPAAASRPAPAARPAPAKPSARARVEDDEEEEAHPSHHHYDPRHQKDNVLKYATIGGLALLLAGAAFAGFAFKQSKDKEAKREFEAAEIAKMEETIKVMKNDQPDNPQAVLAKLDEFEKKFADFENRNFVRYVGINRNEMIELKGKLEFQGKAKSDLESAEKELDTGADPRAILQKLELVISNAATIGTDFKARVDATVKKAADLAVVKIKDEALKFADENKGKLDEVFAKLGSAEKEIDKIALRGATQKVVADSKRELMERGDALAESSITPEKIESLPWRNLLAAADVGKRGKGGTCEFKIENGVLTIVGPPPDAKDQGVVSIGEDEGIRDFVLEAKLSIKGRGFTVLWRKEPDSMKMGQMAYRTEGPNHVAENEPLTLKIEARGQTGVIEVQPGDLRQPFKMGPEKARKGGFGFSAEAESTLTINEIKIKVIR